MQNSWLTRPLLPSLYSFPSRLQPYSGKSDASRADPAVLLTVPSPLGPIRSPLTQPRRPTFDISLALVFQIARAISLAGSVIVTLVYMDRISISLFKCTIPPLSV